MLDPITLQREATALVAAPVLQRMGVKIAPALARRYKRATDRGLDLSAFSTRGPRDPKEAERILVVAQIRAAGRTSTAG